MKSIISVFGRKGDVILSMFMANIAFQKHGEYPDIVISSKYSEIFNTLKFIGMPINKCIVRDEWNNKLDDSIAGLEMSRYSESLFRLIYPGYDFYYNCCPRWIPDGCHIVPFLAYCGGLSKSPLSMDGIDCPKSNKEWIGKNSNVVLYHFGSSSGSRKINIDKDPFCNMDSFCIGSKNDPCPSWIKFDFRGSELNKVVEMMTQSELVVGSDSLITNLSGLLEIPTICLHHNTKTMLSSNRSIFGKHCISISITDSIEKIQDCYDQILKSR